MACWKYHSSKVFRGLPVPKGPTFSLFTCISFQILGLNHIAHFLLDCSPESVVGDKQPIGRNSVLA